MHQHRVYGYACYLLGDAKDAEDLTQEVLLRLWDHLDTLEEPRVLPWTLRVARNACLDALRKRRSYDRLVSTDDDLIEVACSDSLPPDAVLEAAEFESRLQKAVEGLAEPYRSIVVLREVQDQTYETISEVLGLPLNTVKVYLHRARRRLREKLTEVAHESV